MFGFSVLLLALAKIWNNKDQVLKINGFWFVVVTLTTAPMNLNISGFSEGGTLFWIIGLVGIFATVIGTVIVAIAWHRFVLLGEHQADWLSFGPGWPLSRYFWTSLLPALIGLIALIPMFAFHWEHQNSERLHKALALIVMFAIFFCVVLLLSVVLPAIAIGEPFSFRESLSATAPRFTSIALIAFALSAIMVVPDEILIPIFGDWYGIPFGIFPAIGYVISSVAYWFATLLCVGILSELYRVFRLQKPS